MVSYNTYSEMPDSHKQLYDVLKCALPDDSITDDEYWAVLMVIFQSDALISERTVSRFMSVFANMEYIRVLNDIWGLSEEPKPEILELLRKKMIDCGFEDWVKTINA